MGYAKCDVSIDDEDNFEVYSFPARVDRRQHWNGFVIPWFEEYHAIDVLQWADDVAEFEFQADTNNLIILTSDCEIVEVESKMLYGKRHYCIGGYAWPWREVK